MIECELLYQVDFLPDVREQNKYLSFQMISREERLLIRRKKRRIKGSGMNTDNILVTL